jgi:dipeptidyl aminopeptidase/acylaminoacyl peptidase
MKNLLTGIDAKQALPETPVQPFGDQGDYDITQDGSKVAFLTKAPEKPKANFTTSYIYVVPFDGSKVAYAINGPKNAGTPKHARGASAAPRFSPDGKYLAYFQMDDEIYESDKNRIYIADVSGGSTAGPSPIKELASKWDRSPDLLQWSHKSKTLFVGAQDRGSVKIFSVPLDAKADYKPKNITEGGISGSVASFYVLPKDTLLVSDTAIWNPRSFYTVSDKGTGKKVLFSAHKSDKVLAGLGPEDISEFYTEGNFTEVQSWVVYPEGFSKDKKYPLAFLIHGGPQSAWLNSWSNRWNVKTWADQGYVVVAPNPTGSTGFGQEFQDKIQNNWGGYPYDDLVKVWEHVAKSGKFPYIDVKRGIAGGASYGGYMTNWIQGHDLGREFKALVTHCGSTSTLNQLASEELWFMQRDFNGTLWDDRENYEKWDPVLYAKNWATPQYVVHNTLDYRLPEAEGIMLFNILQELGVPSRFLNFPDEGHWVLNRENSLVWHTEIFNWINHYSGIKVDQSIDTSPYVVPN